MKNVAVNDHEDKVLFVLTVIIGAAVGLTVVAFILLTEDLGARLYPAGGAAWRRVLVPVAGALVTGFLLFRYFPDARGSGIPQTKAGLFLHNGYCTATCYAAGNAGGIFGNQPVHRRHDGRRHRRHRALVDAGLYGQRRRLCTGRHGRRLELVETLNRSGAIASARAELLQAVAEVPKDAALGKRLAAEMLGLGMEREAIAALREILQRDPRDGEAWASLGKPEFAMGEFAAAREPFRRAQEFRAGQTVAQDAETNERVLSLDPLLRGLKSRERYRRSLLVLQGACGFAPGM